MLKIEIRDFYFTDFRLVVKSGSYILGVSTGSGFEFQEFEFFSVLRRGPAGRQKRARDILILEWLEKSGVSPELLGRISVFRKIRNLLGVRTSRDSYLLDPGF